LHPPLRFHNSFSREKQPGAKQKKNSPAPRLLVLKSGYLKDNLDPIPIGLFCQIEMGLGNDFALKVEVLTYMSHSLTFRPGY